MRRKVNWAIIGTTGVLAAIVATTLVSQQDSAPRGPKITVPQASGADSARPGDVKPQAPTVFIPIVPPVAVTSASSVVQTPAQPSVEQVVAPRKNPPAPAEPAPPQTTTPPAKTAPPKTTKPKPAQGPSYWDVFAYYAGRGYDYYRDEYEDDDDYYGDNHRSSHRGDSHRGRGGDGYHR